MTQMTAFTAAYAHVGADPLLVDCLVIADPPESISTRASRLGIERYGIVTVGGWPAVPPSPSRAPIRPHSLPRFQDAMW